MVTDTVNWQKFSGPSRKAMKIIQICAAYKPAYIYGGPTMSVSKLSEELVKAGQEVIVLATTANGKTELDVPAGKAQDVDGVKVFYFKRLTKDHTHFSPALLLHLHRLILAEKKAGRKAQLVVHIHAWWNLVSIFSCWIAKLHGVKVILSPRGMLNDYTLSNNNSSIKRMIHFVLGESLLKYCTIHTTSLKESDDVLLLLRKKSTVIPNFVKLLGATSSRGVESEVYQLIFLARINEIKGLENLFSALSMLKIKWELTIAGTGELHYVAQLKNLAKSYEIDDRIVWKGHVHDEDKFNLLSDSDLLILPSYKENFSNVVIEALSVGTPVLITEGVGVADYVLEKDLGWVSEQNPKKISETIHQSFLATTKRASIRTAAPKMIRNDFDEYSLTTAYIQMYQHLN